MMFSEVIWPLHVSWHRLNWCSICGKTCKPRLKILFPDSVVDKVRKKRTKQSHKLSTLSSFCHCHRVLLKWRQSTLSHVPTSAPIRSTWLVVIKLTWQICSRLIQLTASKACDRLKHWLGLDICFLITQFLIDTFFISLPIPVKVTQAEVDPLINKSISTTQEIHPQFSLFTCAPRTIIPDAMIPVSLTCYSVLLIFFLFLKWSTADVVKCYHS